MAKVTRDVSARSYIATENFMGDFFKYVLTKVNFNTVGSLPPVTTTSSDCPAGRILRENGRKLAPGMNPNVPTYMVGVYDNQSGLSGFIDPNSPTFAVYSDNRPNFMVDNVDPSPGGLTDHSAPVLTNGLVTAGKLIVPSYSTAIAAATFAAGNAATGNVPLAGGAILGGYKRIVVNTTACSANSRIFLSYSGLGNPGFLSSEGITSGSFTITSTSATGAASYNTVSYTGDVGVVQFFIIN